MRPFFAVAVLITALGGAVSCGKDPMAASGPGTLKVRLTSPNSGADSAIVFTVTGPAALTSATAGSGLRLFAQPLGSTTRFALVGQLNTGVTILTFGVSDVAAANQYSGTIQGVARPNFQLRTLPGGYALAVTR